MESRSSWVEPEVDPAKFRAGGAGVSAWGSRTLRLVETKKTMRLDATSLTIDEQADAVVDLARHDLGGGPKR